MTDLKKAAEALEWLGLHCQVNESGTCLRIEYGTGQYDRTWPDPVEYVEYADLWVPDERPDHENAQAAFLILDALEAKGYMVLLRSPKPRERRPYTVKLVNCPKGGHTEVQGATRTDAVLAAAVAAKEAS